MNSAKTTCSLQLLGSYSQNFFICSRQNKLINENLYNKVPIRIIAVATNTNSRVLGIFFLNSFKYQQFQLRELKNLRGGRAIISLDATCFVDPTLQQ